MKELIKNDASKCIGCNRCIRFCPVEGANIAYKEDEAIKVRTDGAKCIACGACIDTCRHESRGYSDDTEKFLSDLRAGVKISLFAAPANRTNGENGGRLLTWLRRLGVNKIYDVSLGADICTWAHIRHIEKNRPPAIITQPCPAIVNYVLLHRPELAKYLSPVQSPMLCTAIYMKRYKGVSDSLAALSPCIAKSNEFEQTQLVKYNVTFKKLYEYIKSQNIRLPNEATGFDHAESSLGSLFPMPGGLKENIEAYLGKSIRIDKSEGPETVYRALDEYAKQSPRFYPAVFDVLNCKEGCNLGTGCTHEKSMFEINTVMDGVRKSVTEQRGRADFDALYEGYDKELRLNDFLRAYQSAPVKLYEVSEKQIEESYAKLNKFSHVDRTFDCSACGADSCREMARQIALGFNIAANCIQKVRADVHSEHDLVLELSAANVKNIDEILVDISKIKNLTADISQNVTGINTALDQFNKMAKEINQIAMKINIIALNASVEAARAGQFGKAFGVIAEEIRSLANSSKKTVAATEDVTEKADLSITYINNMIKQISGEVEKAYNVISDISEKTQKTLQKDGLIK
ncbi:MAG: methyl-accepting chemotaxis protein [Defluviitaleaceae bacterium]|nr:methyl-accepting chemotaxis protein [Defluviitaleaceae bacterium]